MNSDPEHFTIRPEYVDPSGLAAYELARSEWDVEHADRRRDAEEDARFDRGRER